MKMKDRKSILNSLKINKDIMSIKLKNWLPYPPIIQDSRKVFIHLQVFHSSSCFQTPQIHYFSLFLGAQISLWKTVS